MCLELKTDLRDRLIHPSWKKPPPLTGSAPSSSIRSQECQSQRGAFTKGMQAGGYSDPGWTCPHHPGRICCRYSEALRRWAHWTVIHPQAQFTLWLLQAPSIRHSGELYMIHRSLSLVPLLERGCYVPALIHTG